MSESTVMENTDPVTEVDVVTEVIRDPELRKLPIEEARKAAAEKLSAEKKTPESTADAEGDDQPSADEDSTEEKPKKSKSALEKRFSELAAQRDEARRKAEALEARLAQLEAKTGQPKQQEDASWEPAQFDKPKPKLDDFQSYAEYEEALVDWKLDKREFDAQQRNVVAQAKQMETKAVSAWEEREKATKARVEGYDQLIDQEFVADFTKSIASRESLQYLLESEHGPDLLVELRTDDDLMRSFKSMNPVKQVAFLSKLEGKFETPAKTEKSVATTTKAPAPSKPLPKGKTTTTAPSEFTRGMSFAEYNAWRSKQK